jgi:threonine synthase
MSIWRWADKFSNVPVEFRFSLGEGNTPLVRSRHIGPAVGLENLYFKLEGMNPTGSYKDRFAAAAISDMLSKGKRRCVATSSGNTGAALAAYCAAAELRCEIAAVETAPTEKLAQMRAYGANVFKVKGFGVSAEITREAFRLIQQRAGMPDAELQISAYKYSPTGMAGVQTISYEIAEQLHGKIDHVFVPAGGGGLTLAIARGFENINMRRVKIECVQPVGNDTIATPLTSGAERARAVSCTTEISGLQVASVLDGDDVIRACRRSGGTGHVVDDEAVWKIQKRLAREEGIFAEPAGAVATAAAVAGMERGEIDHNAVVCCVVTGIGFKDSPSVGRMVGTEPCRMVGLEELAELPQQN